MLLVEPFPPRPPPPLPLPPSPATLLPPFPPVAVLPVSVELRMVSVPVLNTAPPSPAAPPPLLVPPLPPRAIPPVSVRLCKVRLPVLLTWNSRMPPVWVTLMPVAPLAPSMVIGLLPSRADCPADVSPTIVSVIVPVRPAAKPMLSGPAREFAPSTALRKFAAL